MARCRLSIFCKLNNKNVGAFQLNILMFLIAKCNWAPVSIFRSLVFLGSSTLGLSWFFAGFLWNKKKEETVQRDLLLLDIPRIEWSLRMFFLWCIVRQQKTHSLSVGSLSRKERERTFGRIITNIATQTIQMWRFRLEYEAFYILREKFLCDPNTPRGTQYMHEYREVCWVSISAQLVKLDFYFFYWMENWVSLFQLKNNINNSQKMYSSYSFLFHSRLLLNINLDALKA